MFFYPFTGDVRRLPLFRNQGERMLIIAGGIAMGFIAVDVTAKLIKTVLIYRRSGR